MFMNQGARYSSAIECLTGGRLSGSGKMDSHQLARHQKQISWAQQKVSTPESARFSTQPKQPLQTAILHPPGRLVQCTCQVWESCTHGDNRHTQPLAKF